VFMQEWTQDLGAICGGMEDAFPQGINGYPMFHKIKIIHKEDWARIFAACVREQDRAKDLEV